MAKKILLAEDEPDVLRIAGFRLEKAGYKVIKAIDGQQALDLAQEERPDLVLLDLVMPRVEGYEVAKRLKADAQLKDIPIILFTASVTSDLWQKLNDTGAKDYIIKPFEPEELLEKVEKFVR